MHGLMRAAARRYIFWIRPLHFLDQAESVAVAKARASLAESLMSVTRVNDAILTIRECVKQGGNPKLIFSPTQTASPKKLIMMGLASMVMARSCRRFGAS
jgi:hypothetical protein